MNTKRTIPIWLALTALLVLACICPLPGPTPTPTPSLTSTTLPPTPTITPPVVPDDHGSFDELAKATVLILMAKEQAGKYELFGSGSGTIISADGMILTNAHVASPASIGKPEFEPDALFIAMVTSVGKEPEPAYIAKVEEADGVLDLAVLQITSTMDGSFVNKTDLNLPFIEMGYSKEVQLGDHINIFGFPAKGTFTITYTEGIVSGFTSDELIGDQAWIKTDATISGGNSGGLAANDDGQIIGVPTSVTGCRPTKDTNNDGQIDDKDWCISSGNDLAHLRPVDFAKPMIDAVLAGHKYVSPYTSPDPSKKIPSDGDPVAKNFVWLDTAASSADQCKPGKTIVTSYSATALCVAAGFDYSGMTNGEVVETKWYRNNETVGGHPHAWEWNTEGSLSSSLGNKGKPMAPGEYYIELYVGDDNRLIGTSSKVIVGGGIEPKPQPKEDTVTFYGKIYDVDTDKPIPGAAFVVLRPGITVKQWFQDGKPPSSIYMFAEASSNGLYEITLPRNLTISMAIGAKGYKAYLEDNISLGAFPERVQLNVGLTK